MDYAAVANRMAREQQRLAVIAGNLSMHGEVISSHQEVVLHDLSANQVLSAPLSAARPGWACDYLLGGLEPRFIGGNMVLDAWGHPLLYICQAVPGVDGTTCNMFGQPTTVYITNSAMYGCGPRGFDVSQGPGPGLKGTRPWLLYNGRVRLSTSDAGDGQPTPVDPTYYPQPGNLMHADMRYYAVHGFEEEFELWSAGNDGAASYMRDDPANADNVAIQPYTKEISSE
jgi:hypothetical protein